MRLAKDPGAKRARLIGRKKQRDGGGGSAISLRGLERVHARGQRCRAGQHSTSAPQLKHPKRQPPSPCSSPGGLQVRAVEKPSPLRPPAANAPDAAPRCKGGWVGEKDQGEGGEGTIRSDACCTGLLCCSRSACGARHYPPLWFAIWGWRRRFVSSPAGSGGCCSLQLAAAAR